MGSIGIWQVVIIGVIVVLLFGRGKISELMGDVAKGIKSFKKGLVEEDSEVDTANTIEHSETPGAEPVEKKTEAS
jgi:sec-independent protein translocase protein TatA